MEKVPPRYWRKSLQKSGGQTSARLGKLSRSHSEETEDRGFRLQLSTLSWKTHQNSKLEEGVLKKGVRFSLLKE